MIWHNGGTGGYAAYIGLLPKFGVGVVVSCNGAERVVDEVGMKIIEKLAK